MRNFHGLTTTCNVEKLDPQLSNSAIHEEKLAQSRYFTPVLSNIPEMSGRTAILIEQVFSPAEQER